MRNSTASSGAEQLQQQLEFRITSVVLIFATPALGGLLFGYDIGATAFVIQQLQSSTYSGVSWNSTVASSAFLQGLIVAVSAIGAFSASWVVFQLNDRVGRRQELRIGALLYMVGAAIAALSSFEMMKEIAISILIIGRLIYGCGIGFTMHGAPTYIAEMSPPSIRGTLISLKEAAIVFGILLGYGPGYAFQHVIAGWRYQYAASIPIAAAVVALTLVIPRSARWLVLAGRYDEAREALSFVLVDVSGIERELQEMIQEQTDAREKQQLALQNGGQKDNIFRPARRAPLVAGVGLVVLQQITGQPSVLSYATVIFESVMLGGSASVVVAIFKLFATLSAAVTVEKFGRKSLLYVGCLLMLVALVTLVFSLGKYDSMDDMMDSMNEGSVSELQKVATLGAMFLYIGGYQIGFGPISWLMISEVFPLSIRGQAVAFSVQMNFFLNFVVQLIVPILESLVGLSSTFAIFAVLSAYSLFFVHNYVPETKGLTLEEIEENFKKQKAGGDNDDEDGIEAQEASSLLP